MKFVATCAFGIEAVLKREIQSLNFKIVSTTNGRIYFEGNQEVLFLANLHLRTADRIQIVLGEQKVLSYDNLFDFIKTLDLKSYLGPEGEYVVLAKSVKSKLYSPRDIQSIVKKALIENLRVSYQKNQFLENKERYRLTLELQKDQAELWLDTSGDALHKRGYRSTQGIAPLKETLASALVQLSYFSKDRVLYDPFCGSGTIVIEAAMMAKNIAPGLNRPFDFQKFPWINLNLFKDLKKDALQRIHQDLDIQLYASDIDPSAIEMAKENAIEAGVEDIIHFELADFEDKAFDQDYGIIITNPPYGERLETHESAEVLYRNLGKKLSTLKNYSIYLITSYPGVESLLHKKADRTRVLFNGNIKSRYYQYYGPKPEK